MRRGEMCSPAAIGWRLPPGSISNAPHARMPSWPAATQPHGETRGQTPEPHAGENGAPSPELGEASRRRKSAEGGGVLRKCCRGFKKRSVEQRGRGPPLKTPPSPP